MPVGVKHADLGVVPARVGCVEGLSHDQCRWLVEEDIGGFFDLTFVLGLGAAPAAQGAPVVENLLRPHCGPHHEESEKDDKSHDGSLLRGAGRSGRRRVKARALLVVKSR
jgi:hypothetical protein